jgi:thiamine kinase-like enzyme
MNQNQLTELCNLFKLGMPIAPPEKVHGGLLHRMWCFNTNVASYAIKQLSPQINLSNKNTVNNYNLTEEIASRLARLDIPAVSALQHSGKYLTVLDNTCFLLYPWVDGKVLNQDKVSESCALDIAKLLAKIHFINLDVPEIATPEFDIHLNSKLLQLFHKAEQHNCPFAATLIKNQDDITAINTAYCNTIPLLKKQIVVSHGDLDQKNVLWDENDYPILIDWECARKVNPTHELINAGLDWSGITTKFNKSLFIKMIRTYTASGGVIDRNILGAAFHAVVGNWINWMAYNIERACALQDSEQKTLGIEQVNQVLNTIIQLKSIIPDLMNSI